MADTSLTVEGGQAKHCQAQLTRLQSALGLKPAIDDLEKHIYGQKLTTVDPNKPTNFSRKGNVILASLDLLVKEKDGVPNLVFWAIRTFDTAALGNAAPKDYVQMSQKSRTFGGNWFSTTTLQEFTLGGVRHAINESFEPMCLDHCGNSEHQNERNHHAQPSNGLSNPKSDHCDNPAHKTSQDNYDHTRHKTCKPRRNIILLVSERAETLRCLQMLGCDPHKHLHVIDIISVDELYQAFLARGDYRCRNPMTGNHRTKINRDWEDLSTIDQIRTTLGYETDIAYVSRDSTLSNLKSAINIACKDAISSSWLRTPEQIDGGAFPGPWLKLRSRKQAEEFLIEYDVARASPICYNKMKVQVKALTESLRLLSPSVLDALVRQIARTHNYTHLLDDDAAEGPPTLSANVPDPPNAAQNDTSSLRVAAKSLTVHPSKVTATESANHTPAVAPSPRLPTLPLGTELDEDTQYYCYHYNRDQEAFEEKLKHAPMSPDKKKEYDSLFDWKPYLDQKGRSKITPITCDNYPRVFAILNGTPDWVMGEVMAKKLRGAIYNREQAQKWYERLPATDPRRDEDGGHRNFIKVLKEGEAILRKKSA